MHPAQPYGYGVVGQTCRYPEVYAGSTTAAFFDYGPEAVFKWEVRDDGGNLIGGTSFRIDSTKVPFQNVTDDIPADVDPISGKYTIPIRFEGTWTACLDQLPAGYAIAPNQPKCASRDVKMQTGWHLGTFMIVPVYSASWTVTNRVTAIGPSTFKVLSGSLSIDVVDNGVNDYNPTLGKLAVKLPSAGPYSVREIVPPVNHWNANPSCHRITVEAGVPASAGYFINYEKQVYYPGPRG